MSKAAAETQTATDNIISEKIGNGFRRWSIGSIRGRKKPAKDDSELNEKKQKKKSQEKDGKKEPNTGLPRTDSMSSSKQALLPQITGRAAAAFNKFTTGRKGSKGQQDFPLPSVITDGQVVPVRKLQPESIIFPTLKYNPRGANETSDALIRLSSVIFSVAMGIAPKIGSFPGFFPNGSCSKHLSVKAYEDAFLSGRSSQQAKANVISAVISAYIWDAIQELRVFTPDAAADLAKVAKCPYTKADATKQSEEEILEARMVNKHGYRKGEIPADAEAVVRKLMVALFEHLFGTKSIIAAGKVAQASTTTSASAGNGRAVVTHVPVKGADADTHTFSKQFQTSGFSHLWTQSHLFLQSYDPEVKSVNYKISTAAKSSGAPHDPTHGYPTATAAVPKPAAQQTLSYLKLSTADGPDFSPAVKPKSQNTEQQTFNTPTEDSEEFRLIVKVLGPAVWKSAMDIKNQKGKIDVSFTPEMSNGAYRQAQRAPIVKEMKYFDEASTEKSLCEQRWEDHPSGKLVWFPEVTVYTPIQDDVDGKERGVAFQSKAAAVVVEAEKEAEEKSDAGNAVGVFHTSRVLNEKRQGKQ